MKKALFLFITFYFGFTVKSQTSIYHSFPDSAATWNFHYVQVMSNCPPNGQTINQYYSITITGDTLIGANLYHKLHTPFVQITPSNCTALPTGYQGAIREDSNARKVFFVPPFQSAEQLLYDFNLQVGDTVKGYIETGRTSPDVIQSIDSVLVGNTYRKRWFINSMYGIYFIEGIGSTYGLFQFSPGIVDGPSISLTCFRENNQPLYPSNVSSCNLITSNISKESTGEPEAKVFPNPANNKIRIESAGMKAFALFDLHSRLMFRHQTQESADIEIHYLPGGLYTLLIETSGSTIAKKLIVSH